MRVFDSKIPDVKIIEPTIYEDNRGYFFEAYNALKFNEAFGFYPDFHQVNESFSKRGTIRGLHLQKEPHSQAKLVRAIHGKVIDVVLDCRAKSSTFGKHVCTELNSSNKRQVWVPRGCAHGFQVISEFCILSYQVDAPYNRDSQVSIDAFDESLEINWHKMPDVYMSAQDRLAVKFSDFVASTI